jgi:DNA-3-methyladenine glycosylase I
MEQDHHARCGWAGTDPVYVLYHDTEWGVPVHDDQKLFEMLSLEGAQAGLSWITILKRRADYKVLFDDFVPATVAAYDQSRIEHLLTDSRIIRNRLKIQSVVTNAQAFLQVQAEFGTFNNYLWGFVGGNPKVNCFASLAEVPATSPESDALSKDLKRRGFKFVGSTICYAFMQACGLVNDHLVTCPAQPRVAALATRGPQG